MQQLLAQLLHWLEQFQSLGFPGVLAYGTALVVFQIACIPLSPFAMAAGGAFGFWQGFIALTIGTNAGAAVNFLIARHFARNAVHRWLGHHEKFRLIDGAIGREGWKIIALLRFCPIPFGFSNYAYGLTAIGFWPYFLATFFAIIPANCFFVWLGTTARHGLAAAAGAEAGKHPGEWVLTAVGLTAFFLALRYITKVARTAVAKAGPAALE